MKNVQSKVGRRIRDIRVSQGIPQGQLADMAHMTKSYMSEIEAGKKKSYAALDGEDCRLPRRNAGGAFSRRVAASPSSRGLRIDALGHSLG
jgi:Predicted transcriptional regulator with C-terminal CBS domains